MSETDIPDVVTIDVDTAIAAARAAAWDEGERCPHCEGAGRRPGGRKLIHSRGSMFGADWDLAGVEAEIRGAKQVAWIASWGGHDLVVLDQNSKQWSFEVKRPADVLPDGRVS